jgi:hypothetical protein
MYVGKSCSDQPCQEKLNKKHENISKDKSFQAGIRSQYLPNATSSVWSAVFEPCYCETANYKYRQQICLALAVTSLCIIMLRNLFVGLIIKEHEIQH